MDDDKLDREWIVRNVLGGMSAGFGLRGAFASTFPYMATWLFKISSLVVVILDWHPAFTTIIILAGWVAKTLVASLVSGWVGGDEQAGEAWLAYSIP
jgi:lipid intermediate transporter